MEQQDKFLEYCSGKVFSISWIGEAGDEIQDRWIAFGKDAEIALNFLRSSSPDRESIARFEPRRYMNDRDYTIALALNSELDVNQVGFIVGEVVIFKSKGSSNLLKQLVNHINTIVYGEDCGN